VQAELEEVPVLVPNEGFTDSNQGHSAQFHGYLGDTEVSTRDDYWLDVMDTGFNLDPDGAYSKLYPR
jgi:hypothetical protein